MGLEDKGECGGNAAKGVWGPRTIEATLKSLIMSCS